MKFNKFMAKLTGVQDKYNISSTELIIINQVASNKEAVTIMTFINGFSQTSPATTHGLIKKLTQKKLLKISIHPNDGRIKLLGVGEKFPDLVKYVETI